MPTASSNVRVRGQSGPDLSGRSLGRQPRPYRRRCGSRCETREGQREYVSRPPMSSRGKRGRAHHQPEAVVLDFVNLEFFAAFFFSALRFLVAVSSDLSGCSCVLKALFSKLSRRPLILAIANPIFLFHRLTRYQGPIAQNA